MARWKDVVDAERKMHAANSQRDEAVAHAATLCQFIREIGQGEAYMKWTARRLGLYEKLYGGNGQ